MVVEGWLARAAAQRPERMALETPGGSCSYEQLLLLAHVGAVELSRLGVRRGQRVAIALPPGLAFAQALHSCLLAGAVAVPVDLRLSPVERARIAEGSVLLLDEPLPLAGAPQVDHDADSPSVHDLGSSSTHDLGSASTHDRHAASMHDLDAAAVVIHTSGTTSSPRAIELTYGNLLWSALGSAVALGLDADERWLCALPVSHVGGLSILVRSTIYATTAIVHERFETDRVLEALRERRVTLVSLVATTLARLLDAGLTEPPALRCALTGGGPVPRALIERARDAGVPISLTYGLTESCSQVTTTPHAALLPGAEGTSASLPLFCTRVRCQGDGEIVVSGPTIAASALDHDGQLHTGDLGEIDELGALRVSGRRADTIVTGGENVAPSEVEGVLESYPGVLEAAVIARADPEWGEAVTALVRARPDAELDLTALIAHCARALAAYKVPKSCVLVEQPLPRTRSGKLLRRELR